MEMIQLKKYSLDITTIGVKRFQTIQKRKKTKLKHIAPNTKNAIFCQIMTNK